MNWISRLLGPVALLSISVLFAEALLRVIPSPIQNPSLHEFDNPKSLLGIELVPSTQQIVRGTCFQTTVSTNAQGWRDKERSMERLPGKFRIAVLGDSFIEGTHVEDGKTLTQQLEHLLGEERTEVLNFGLSSIGTVQEDILYEYVVSHYHPDLVLLAFYSNDVLNSDPLLDSGTSGSSRLTFRAADGSLMHTRTGSPLFALRRWLRIHSAMFRLLKATYGRARQLLNQGNPIIADPSTTLPPSFAVYGKPQTDDWKRAWSETEAALVRLRAKLDPTNRFFVMSLPEVLQLSPDPRSLVKEQYGIDPPMGFNPRYPHDQLQAIAQRNKIPFVDLLPAFLAKRDAWKLEYPYFSFPCDGHWSASGHTLAAQVLAKAISPLLDAPPKF